MTKQRSNLPLMTTFLRPQNEAVSQAIRELSQIQSQKIIEEFLMVNNKDNITFLSVGSTSDEQETMEIEEDGPIMCQKLHNEFVTKDAILAYPFFFQYTNPYDELLKNLEAQP